MPTRPNTYDTPKGIRGLDRTLWARFKAQARVRDRSVGELMNEVMGWWLDRANPNNEGHSA